MAVIRLPRNPTGEDYEDFAAAWLSALGYFIETNLHYRRKSVELTELDIVASPSDKSPADRIIVEAKSASSGFGDMFKLYGLKLYLRTKGAMLVVRKGANEEKEKELSRLGDEIGVARSILDAQADHFNELIPSCTTVEDSLRTKLFSTAWFHHIAKRLALAEFRDHCRGQLNVPLVAAARAYDDAIEQAFFGPTALERVWRLYSAWQKSKNLVGDFLSDLETQQGVSRGKIIQRLENTSDELWLQYYMLLEHIARIGIVKNAIDHVAAKEPDKIQLKIRDKTFMIEMKSLLPQHFGEGLIRISEHPHFHRIPYLLQIFVHYFGGFYFTNTGDDLRMLSAYSGIPQEQVADSLKLFDTFFPFDRSWFYTQKNNLMRLKWIPSFVSGCGCFLRKSLYDIKDYEERYPEMGWLLTKWHNAIFHTLEQRLAIKDESSGT